MAASLRLRLAAWYGVLTGVVVLLVCGYSYAIHSRVHYDELDATLRGIARPLVRELGAAPDPWARVASLQGALPLGASVRVFDGAGRVLAETAAGAAPAFAPRAVLRALGRAPHSRLAALAPAHDTHAVTEPGVFGLLEGTPGSGERWRLLVAEAAPGGRVVAVMVPLDHIDASVGRFGRFMGLMAAAGAAAAFVLGWLVAGRALRPVALLTDAAGSIARSRQLSRRVPVGPKRDELGRLATTFNEMLASLAEAHAAQQRFVSDASHELRAPLTVIQANLELLRRDRIGAAALGEAERAAAFEEAYAETRRMARLVADLLALARADAGLSLRREPVELDRVLMDVLGEARLLARGHALRVGTLEQVTVLGDADRLKQLLLVLFDNALRYTPPGGEVRADLSVEAGRAVLVVHDTGIGISAEDLPRVFERFYRADPARSRDPGGTGLGLTIARWIAEQHGAHLRVDSTLGKGTSASIVVPVALREPSVPPQEVSVS